MHEKLFLDAGREKASISPYRSDFSWETEVEVSYIKGIGVWYGLHDAL